MKLEVDVNEVTLSGISSTGEFRIRNSAKAFKILSDGLYSNKIRAIIRELSCNAIDSHVAAGKENIQFEVHLPTIMEPWFSVKDFGLGLSGDQVTNIYTTYFESTKTDSNAYIGALGLGSKSPFSYTENFTITAIKDGMKRIYSAFINDSGIPCVAEMSTELTDEGNGVEVKFSVMNRYDYGSFRHEAVEVFKWFKSCPKIIGSPLIIEPVSYKEKDIVPGVHTLLDNKHYNSCMSMALMGNIAYPLNKIPEPKKHFGDLAPLLECGLVLEFDIGELDFAASREELSYIPQTLNSIKKRLEDLNSNLVEHLSEKANKIANEWDRAIYLYEQYQTGLYRGAVPSYVANTKFELFGFSNNYYRYEFEIDQETLEDKGLEITAFRVHSNTTNKVNLERKCYSKGTSTLIRTVAIPLEKNVVFVLNDLKTGCKARARYHYARFGKGMTVYCVTSNKTVDDREGDYDWLMKKIHNPPTVVKASTLEKPEKKKQLSTHGIVELSLKAGSLEGYAESYGWKSFSEEFDEDSEYYYVAMSGHQELDINGGHLNFNIKELKAMMSNCGIPKLKDMRILGVRKNRIGEIKKLPNWVWFEEKLKEEIGKVTDKNVISLVATKMLDSYYNRVYTNKKVAGLVEKNSDYYKFMQNFAGIPKATGNVVELVNLCTRYGKSIQVEKVKNEIEDAKEKLALKYPLLKHLTNASETEIAEYIKLVDRQEHS